MARSQARNSPLQLQLTILHLVVPCLVLMSCAAGGLGTQEAYLSFRGNNYTANNSYILLTDVREGSNDSITCHTDLSTCCRSKDTGSEGMGEWYSPNGTVVPSPQDFDIVTDYVHPFYRTRNTQSVVRLNFRYHSNRRFRGILESLPGRYCCVIPTSIGEQKLCVNLGIQCKTLPPVINGLININTSVVENGTVVTYSCKEGHYLLGNMSRTCQDDFTWSDSPPSCPRGCQDLYVANGQSTYNKEHLSSVRPVGTVANTSCDVGYYSSGDVYRTCQNGSGTWSGNDAVCTPGIFQLRLNRISSCHMWLSYNSTDKYNDIIAKLAQGINTLCQDCGFTAGNIVDGFLRCFPDSSDHVTLRAQLTGTSQVGILHLLSYVEDWVQSTQSVTVLHVSLGVNRSCPSVIEDLDQPECHTVTTVGSTTTEVEVTTHMQGIDATCATNSPQNCFYFVGGIAILGCLWIVTLLVLVVVSILLAIARKSLKKAIRINKEHAFSVNPSYRAGTCEEADYYEDVSHFRNPNYNVPHYSKPGTQTTNDNVLVDRSNGQTYDNPALFHTILPTSPPAVRGDVQPYMNLPLPGSSRVSTMQSTHHASAGETHHNGSTHPSRTSNTK